MKEIDTKSFSTEVLTSSTPVVVDFYAPWCGPCRMLGPTLEALAKEYEPRVKFLKVNVDTAPELAYRYDVSGVPTLLLFRDGAEVDRVVGMPGAKALRSRVDALKSAAPTATCVLG